LRAEINGRNLHIIRVMDQIFAGPHTDLQRTLALNPGRKPSAPGRKSHMLHGRFQKIKKKSNSIIAPSDEIG